MKNLTLSILMIALALPLISQEESSFENKFRIGGSANFFTQDNYYPISASPSTIAIGGVFSSSSDNLKESYFNFRPHMLRELNENWLIGVNLDFTKRSHESENFIDVFEPQTLFIERRINNIGFDLFARYLMNPESNFGFYIQPYVGFLSGTAEYDVDGNRSLEESHQAFKLGMGMGLQYKINDKWFVIVRSGALEYLDGSWEKTIPETEEGDFSGFGFNLNLRSFGLGAEYRF